MGRASDYAVLRCWRPERASRDRLSVKLHMVVSEDSPRVVRWRRRRDVDQRRRVNVLQRSDAIGNVGYEIMLERPELAVPVAPAFLDRSDEVTKRLKSRTRLAEHDAPDRDDAGHDREPA